MGAVGPGKERGLEKQEVRRLLSLVAEGALPVEGALAQLEGAGFADLGYARVDTRRQLRTGVTEVVYGEGKTAEQVVGICQALADAGQGRVLVTRLDAEKAAAVQEALPHAQYWENCHLLLTASLPEPDGKGVVAVVCAGTSDLSVAEEAALTAEALGNRVERVYDAGVAGLHRLFSSVDVLAEARVIIVVAGMEGALPSVVAGLVSAPVLAVPTSVGYGASLGGVAALLAMLNSCSSGISVVNIDNGFGAAFQASLINHL